VDTDTDTPATPRAPNAPLANVVTSGALYQSANEALKAVQDDYLYWTEKLTDTSLQLSYAVIAELGSLWFCRQTFEQLLVETFNGFGCICLAIERLQRQVDG